MYVCMHVIYYDLGILEYNFKDRGTRGMPMDMASELYANESRNIFSNPE